MMFQYTAHNWNSQPALQVWWNERCEVSAAELLDFYSIISKVPFQMQQFWDRPTTAQSFKLTWLVLGGDPAARSHRVEQFTAL